MDEYKKLKSEKKKHQFSTRMPNEGFENDRRSNVKLLEKLNLEDAHDGQEVVHVCLSFYTFVILR